MEEKRARAKWHAKRKALRRKRLMEAAVGKGNEEGGGGEKVEGGRRSSVRKQQEFREQTKNFTSMESNDSCLNFCFIKLFKMY